MSSRLRLVCGVSGVLPSVALCTALLCGVPAQAWFDYRQGADSTASIDVQERSSTPERQRRWQLENQLRRLVADPDGGHWRDAGSTVAQRPCVAGELRLSGMVPSRPAEGSGDSVPLAFALEMLKPQDWHLALEGVDAEFPVDWRRGTDWLAVLSAVLPAQRYCAHADGHARLLRVMTALRQHTADSVDADNTVPDFVRDSRGHTRPDAEKQVKVWKLDKGDTLHATLQRWSDMAGWQLVWEPEKDYRVDAHSSYVGGYQQAVENLIDDLSHSGLPLGADLYNGNRVLRIRRVR